MKIKTIATKKKKLPAKKTIVRSSELALLKKDRQIKKLEKEVDTLRSEMLTLLELGKTVNKQKELLNKVLRFHKADKIELEKAVKNRTKQFEQKNTELKKANKKLAFQNKEKEKRAAELSIANEELAFQNEEKEKRAEELSVANKDLTAFTYISSHDLQEPLRKIQNFATIILKEEEKNLSDNGKSYFEKMQNTAKRMQELIEDLLTYSRAKSTERNFEKIHLGIIIDEAKSDLEELILEKKAIIESENLSEMNIIPFPFRQLMNNLISNSLKFSLPNIPPHIIIKTKIKEGSKFNNDKLLPKISYCHITYMDNGIGFDGQYNERIFEVFQRLHSKEQYAGTGMGLAICKRIVENHNGIIVATGVVSKGVTFDIYIPTETTT